LNLQLDYIVVSSLKHDTRTLESRDIQALLSSSIHGTTGLQRIRDRKKLDDQMMSEMGDLNNLGDCKHDDLPAGLPAIETGFDRSFVLLAQEKPSDFLDLVIERESLLRVSIHTHNEKNQISAYLLEHERDEEAVAWTVGTGNSRTFVRKVKP